jgi:four helix bundle protein
MPRSTAKTFQDLVVWKRAHALTLGLYGYSGGFPRSEVYGLSSQLRRAGVSVAANIAEGFRRRGRGDKTRFLNIAQASLEECRYYLILAKDLDYGESASLMEQLEEVSRLLTRYADTILNSDS